MNQTKPSYIPKDNYDEVYFGAAHIVADELAYVHERRKKLDGDTDVLDAEGKPVVGLALSGGGIRSASFSLGVMQALAYAGWLKKIDYLSTVSGGGYIGSTLTWMLSNEWDSTDGKKQFGVDRNNFPLGTYPIATGDNGGGAAEAKQADDIGKYRGQLLRHLRQHGRYLLPGAGIDIFSGLAVILRNALFGVLVYGFCLVIPFVLLGVAGLIPASCGYEQKLEVCVNAALSSDSLYTLYKLAGVMLLLFVLTTALYAPMTTRFGASGKDTNYQFRKFYERWIGRGILILALLMFGLGSVPVAYGKLMQFFNPEVQQEFVINVEQVKQNQWTIAGKIALPETSATENEADWLDAIKKYIALITGVVSSVVGVLTSLMALRQSSTAQKGKKSNALVIQIAAAALLFGLVMVAFHIYLVIHWWWLLAIGAVVFLLAGCCNVNYLSLHRFYRDRLMETFMPNAFGVENVSHVQTNDAKHADAGFLSEMCPAADNGNRSAPYHILNTNIMLVSSRQPKYHARGGDNFILSPFFSGSNATGWCVTGASPEGKLGFDGMTLATAMAISGAAVNPNTGTGGVGVTRQPLLSFLMGVLNIRLGYWVRNPKTLASDQNSHNPSWFTKLQVMGRKLLLNLSDDSPSGLYPALAEILARRYLEETSRWVQLSDGGHFENLGLYELVRRRLQYIIVCDGTADKDYTFSDLANAMERVRADFGARICISSEDLETLRPDDSGNAETGFLIADIKYAVSPDANANTQGKLIYMTTTFFEKLTADLAAYRKTNPDFPDQPTADQFFDENQFEAYRELGYQTAYHMMLSDAVCTAGIVKALGEPNLSEWQESRLYYQQLATEC